MADVAALGWQPSRVGGYASPPGRELEEFGLADRLHSAAATR